MAQHPEAPVDVTKDITEILVSRTRMPKIEAEVLTGYFWGYFKTCPSDPSMSAVEVVKSVLREIQGEHPEEKELFTTALNFEDATMQAIYINIKAKMVLHQVAKKMTSSKGSASGK